MPKVRDWEEEVQPDPEDIALLEHIFGEEADWEDDAVEDYMYPEWREEI